MQIANTWLFYSSCAVYFEKLLNILYLIKHEAYSKSKDLQSIYFPINQKGKKRNILNYNKTKYFLPSSSPISVYPNHSQAHLAYHKVTVYT
jgi:hypothetical protein